MSKRHKNDRQGGSPPANPHSGETLSPNPGQPEQAKPKQVVVVIKPRTLGLAELMQRACLYSATKEEQDQVRTQFSEIFSSLTENERKAVAASLSSMKTHAAVAIIRSIGLNKNQQAAKNEMNMLAINLETTT